MTKILGIPGSLREGSYNAMLLRAAVELAPDSAEVDVYDGLGELPLYNGDLDTDEPPAPVARLQQLVEEADALLIATPEYNYGVPGVLKNAIDWASRPTGGIPRLDGKPIAIMGASPTNFGTVRAQLALRQTFLWTNSRLVTKPEVMMMHAQDRFDPEGRLTDETGRELVGELVRELLALASSPVPVANV